MSRSACFFSLILASSLSLSASDPPPTATTGDVLNACCGEMRYRMIGPFRGGRTKAAAGIPDQPNVFYVGAVNGGVWKTTDYGNTWAPIFDDQPTGSIGAIAIAPSNASTIYVGSGEGLQRPDLSTGDGIYKSTDAGRTWTHLGLRDGQQIPQIAVDPRNPDRLFVAVLGHPYGPNPERGIFRSLDGGATFERVLFKNDDTGAADVVIDPSNPDVVYGVLWESRQAPWETGAFTGPGSGLYTSVDGGTTWRPLTAGLPTFATDGLGRIGITVAPSLPQRLFATVEATRRGGLYRSDDGGEHWSLVHGGPYATERADDFAEVKVHPTNPDIVFTASIAAWKSVDGGHTFSALRGAPGGDDYHRIWINPVDPDIILLAADQGVVITVNGGESWSSWYNQPTAQFYHVSTDNAFPYRVCGGQQESGSACVRSRGNDGQITFREWHPVGVEEYGYVAADPRDPDIVYGGKVSRYDRRTGQVQDVSPRLVRSSEYRVLRTMPVLFSPIDPKTLYFASNVVWKTITGGREWTAISPDLTRATWEVPANVGTYRGTPAAAPTRRGVVYALAPSPIEANRIWAGTDDGLIHLTTDGGATWQNVTPATLGPWAKVSLLEASHFDPAAAYAAINTFRLDDLRPHIFRTRDGGRTWTEIVNGLPDGGIVNAVREDPVRRGLLYAGTERAVYVSLDDGDSWQSLRLNMPATSIRDLVVKDDDLVIGTHGRSFWILDNVTPLRQVTPDTARSAVHLFAPQTAWRVRWNMNTDTPLPPDEPRGQNPPDGAVIDYWIGRDGAGPVTLEILDGRGHLVRRFSSDDPPYRPADVANWPSYWQRPVRPLPVTPGMHRVTWDLRWAGLEREPRRYPIAAVPGDTPAEPRGPWAVPGAYTVRLTAAGRTETASLTVRMDPRVTMTPAALEEQFALSSRLADRVTALRARLDAHGPPQQDDERESAPADATVARVQSLHRQALQVYDALQSVDAAPTAATRRAAEDVLSAIDALE
jgi:photosystem II stability/assembly factor-like uncharacterized protein